MWGLFVRINKYIGYPDALAFDQRPQISNSTWNNLLNKHGNHLHPFGVKHHNANGVNERYKVYINAIYREVKENDPSLYQEHALAISIKEANDPAG